ncbi:type IV pilin [Halorientalis brevis]|uniref:Type IV pilin n=1 Tax=Halorientalis brevis TaxID=1126241 RepID=A0ABD6CAQ5_9EURY|nr:type IV pilin N-terminal domain-containing protein [Halorientalis brevis]
MDITKLITDDTAVSPVVGVILMVAITVLLAATAGSFFLGLAGDNTSTPKAAITFEYTADTDVIGGNEVPYHTLKIEHNGGDTVNADTIAIAVSDVSTPKPADGGVGVVDPRVGWNDLQQGSVSDVSAGMAVNVSAKSLDSEYSKSLDDEAFSLKHASAQVVWEDPDDSKSFTLADWTSPTA